MNTAKMPPPLPMGHQTRIVREDPSSYQTIYLQVEVDTPMGTIQAIEGAQTEPKPFDANQSLEFIALELGGFDVLDGFVLDFELSVFVNNDRDAGKVEIVSASAINADETRDFAPDERIAVLMVHDSDIELAVKEAAEEKAAYP